MARPAAARLAAALLLGCLAAPTTASPDGDGRLAYADVLGWAEDDHPAALAGFRDACAAGPLPGVSREAGWPASLGELCWRAAVNGGGRDESRRFFEDGFEPVRIGPAGTDGFLTGYFEPVLEGSLERTTAFPAPLLARPDDVVDKAPTDGPAGVAGLTAARRSADGTVALPDRGAIEAGALGDAARPIVFLRDAVDAFIVHVQGSARIRLPDGREVRAAYAGRNGHPYTALGRVLAERLGTSPATMTADTVWSWLRAHPDEAPALTARNASFIFFRLEPVDDPSSGPTGAAGWRLRAGRSLAVDAGHWPYGVPVWLGGVLPDGRGGTMPLRRLTIAADTGSAIRGSARGDLFVGIGPDAGRIAGAVRSRVDFVVLWPKGLSRPRQLAGPGDPPPP